MSDYLRKCDGIKFCMLQVKKSLYLKNNPHEIKILNPNQNVDVVNINMTNMTRKTLSDNNYGLRDRVMLKQKINVDLLEDNELKKGEIIVGLNFKSNPFFMNCL